jgi:hypothetical protein
MSTEQNRKNNLLTSSRNFYSFGKCAQKQRNKFEDTQLGCGFLDPKRPAQAVTGKDL